MSFHNNNNNNNSNSNSDFFHSSYTRILAARLDEWRHSRPGGASSTVCLCKGQGVASWIAFLFFSPQRNSLGLPQCWFSPRRRWPCCSGGEERVFLAQVLADIRLAERDDASGVEFPRLGGGARADAEALGIVSRWLCGGTRRLQKRGGDLPAACHSCSGPGLPGALGSPRSSGRRGP
jgi:hypothetical protein